MMMSKKYIISIETSADLCSVALSKNGIVEFEYNSFVRNMHDELLADYTNKILKDAKIQLSEVSAVAVSSGPGSFTGLRIGAAFTKGLCFGGSPKFIAVSTLSAFAMKSIQYANNLKSEAIIALIPSHKNLMYSQKFDLQGQGIGNIETLEIEKLNQQVNNNFLYCGAGINRINCIRFNDLSFISAVNINSIAWKMYEKGIFDNEETFEPNYIQEFVPKVSTKSLSI